jgi:Major Facilitator Superfamily
MSSTVFPIEAGAQYVPPGYAEADNSFIQLNIDQRIKLQILLTAAGYWPAVPNVDFSTRLFNAICQFEVSKGGATPEGESEASPIGMLGYLLRNRKVWGLTIGFAAYGYSFYLFLTWLPGYLVSEMHMSIIKSAGYAAIPWLFATISDLVVGGWLIDHLLAKGYDDTRTRKTVLVAA